MDWRRQSCNIINQRKMYFWIKSTEILFQLIRCSQKLTRLWTLRGDRKGTAVTSWLNSGHCSAEKHPARACSYGKSETVTPCSDGLHWLQKQISHIEKLEVFWNRNLVLITTVDMQRAANHLRWLWHAEEVQYIVLYSGGARATPHVFDFRSRRRRVPLWNVVVSWVEEVNLPPLEVSKAL